jgi:hypothetical protein
MLLTISRGFAAATSRSVSVFFFAPPPPLSDGEDGEARSSGHGIRDGIAHSARSSILEESGN